MASNEKVQALVADALSQADIPAPRGELLLDVVARSALDPIPQSWRGALKTALTGSDDTLAMLATRTLISVHSVEFDEDLLATARNDQRQYDRRLLAWEALAPRLKRFEEQEYTFLLSAADAAAPAAGRAVAARALGIGPLTDAQRQRLIGVIRQSGPLEVLALLAPFEKKLTPDLAKHLWEALNQSPGDEAVPADFLVRLVELLPDFDEVERREMIADLNSHTGVDPLKLKRLAEELPTGGVPSGKQVFFGRKAACSACHRVGSEGGKIGPDLSKVGERRNELDLLEAVVFPSASIARGFESHAILTADGVNLTGLIVRETPESLFLRTNDQREIRLKRGDIEAQKPSTISIMPAGLENTMSRQELADLLAYLQSLK